jgi:hypothetical protein
MWKTLKKTVPNIRIMRCDDMGKTSKLGDWMFFCSLNVKGGRL